MDSGTLRETRDDWSMQEDEPEISERSDDANVADGAPTTPDYSTEVEALTASPHQVPNRARAGRRARTLAAAALGPSQGFHHGFHAALTTFESSVEAIRHLHDAVAPHAERLERESVEREIGRLVEDLSREQRRAVGRFARLMSGRSAKGTDRNSDPPSQAATQAGAVAPTEGRDEDRLPTSDAPSGASDAPEDFSKELDAILSELGDEGIVVPALLATVFKQSGAPSRDAILRGALLPAAVGAFEVLIGALATEYYKARPGALGDEPRFSLSDLEGLDSLDDSREEAISQRVDSLIHGDLDDWTRWFDKNPGLKAQNLALDYDALFEVFQRRHVLLHNGGRVSRIYRRRLTGRHANPPDLGERLIVDDAYFVSALDELVTAGGLLAVGTWSKVYPTEEPAALHSLYLYCYDLMLAGQWRPVRRYCEVASKLPNQATASLLIFQVNGWLAAKRLGELQKVRAHIEDWDTSALEGRFKFAKAALLDDFDEAFSFARQLLTQGDLEIEDLLEWPLAEELRAESRFAALVADGGSHKAAAEDEVATDGPES